MYCYVIARVQLVVTRWFLFGTCENAHPQVSLPHSDVLTGCQVIAIRVLSGS